MDPWSEGNAFKSALEIVHVELRWSSQSDFRGLIGLCDLC